MDNEKWLAGVNSRFAEVTENDILRMQDITIPNDIKKTMELGMKVFRDKQCSNTQFAHISSVFSPDRQTSLMPLSLNNNCPSTAPFQSLIQVNSTSIEQNVSTQENLNVTSLSKMIAISSTPTESKWHDFRRNFTNCSFNFYFK